MRPFVRLFSTFSIVALGVIAIPVAASADSTESDTVASTAQSLHTGGQKLFEKALADVELRPDQEDAVEDLKSEAEARHEPVKAAKRDFMKGLADQIEKGKIDRCGLAPKIDALTGAVAKAHPGDRAAFERLHGILDKEQRAKFVDSLSKHWRLMKREHGPSAMVDRMAKKLNLTEEQKSKVEKIVSALHEIHESDPARAEHRERWTKILDAFKGDNFVLDEIAPAGDVAAKAKARVERRLLAAEAVLPVLTEEQRSTLAQMIRDKAQRAGGTEQEGSSDEAPGED